MELVAMYIVTQSLCTTQCSAQTPVFLNALLRMHVSVQTSHQVHLLGRPPMTVVVFAISLVNQPEFSALFLRPPSHVRMRGYGKYGLAHETSSRSAAGSTYVCIIALSIKRTSCNSLTAEGDKRMR